jgi:hypothetical protein
MPFEAALFIAFFILVATIVAMAVIIASRRQAAKEDELKRAASARGWTFQVTREKGYRVHRWTGTTDGVSWVAESLAQASAGKNQQRRRHIARWHGAWSPGINGAMVAMGLPKGKQTFGQTVADGDGFFAKLAQKAVGFAFDKAIDVYFGDGPGKEVDAGAMHRVDARIPGFIVMAVNKDEGARILSQGLEKALVEATNDKGSVLAEANRPWILLRPTSISLARMDRFRSANEIDGFVRAGVGLTQTSRFGHRIGRSTDYVITS